MVIMKVIEVLVEFDKSWEDVMKYVIKKVLEFVKYICFVFV